ncbi:pseudaminic acid synthase [Alteromonas halophila]|uniref:N-acetylneuraminic acid synthase n=1 Tax=Alteromonas halophila TaxID=516698 RepID=A0A918JBW1_9ALTE|nr:pseudaminic acid synthase [Alteromonas halophila]GGW73506.1 N-acetylneuraminic acid synthase [Alteromonas halophila]
MNQFQINQNTLGKDHPVYIIAELSANHEGSLELAKKSVEAIADTGANAVKIQTYTPDVMTLNSDKKWFRTRQDSPWAGGKLYDVYEKGQTPWQWHAQLKTLANSLGLDFFSSPFHPDLVKKLEGIEVPAYKIASLEINDIPLIKAVAKTGKPIIISTGAADVEDIELAIETCKREGNTKIALLKCTSAYPTPLEEVNLNAIPYMEKKYKTVVGLSDHTLGLTAALGATAMGAKVIEKHFILDKAGAGLDREFSLDPSEFTTLVKEVRNMEKAMGTASLDLSPRMINATKFKRSIFVSEDVKVGDTVTPSNIKVLRPGLGLHPKHYESLLGKKFTKNMDKGSPFSLDMIEKD